MKRELESFEKTRSLGLNIKLYRLQKNITQKELSDDLGISVNYLSLIEGGKKYPSLKLIFRMAEILNINASDLLEDDPLQDELSRLANKYNLETVIQKLNEIAKIDVTKKHEDCACQ